MSKYSVVVWKDEGIWSARSPSTPGVYGLGKTKRAALADYLSALRVELTYQKQIGERPHASQPVFLSQVEIKAA